VGSASSERDFSAELWHKLREYLDRYTVGGLERRVLGREISPAELYRVLVNFFRQHVEMLHDSVAGAVKTKALGDRGYFERLHELARQRRYAGGILSLITLCPGVGRSIREKFCEPLREEIESRLEGARSAGELFERLQDLLNKSVEDLVRPCEELPKRGKTPPEVCSRQVKDVISLERLSRMMAYALAMKILAYKLIELNYRDVPQLKPLPAHGEVEVNGRRLKIERPDDAIKALDEFFKTAREKIERKLGIRDFTPLFSTGLYDEIVLGGWGALEAINALIDIADAVRGSLKQLPGVIGYVYEGFIPPSERHQLGEFYTPPAVARLIVRWAVRSGSDRVLDGGCGSGTFLIETYKRLLLLKFSKEYGRQYPECTERYNEHQDVLDCLYGVDVNAFAAQLSSLHLMLMEPRCPFRRLNVKPRDFFSLVAGGAWDGESSVPAFDAVIGNPPYTRWLEIPEDTRDLIQKTVRDLMQQYGLVPAPARGREPGIYVYWIVHATKNLLKNGGRLGMIVSNMWLQTDYGIDFGRFLLDHYKIKALIDVSYRLFEALISTVIVLAEKEPDGNAREGNEVLLVRIPPIDSRLSDKEVERRLDEALRCIEETILPNYEFSRERIERCAREHGIRYRFVRQAEIPRDRKWISLFFTGIEDVVSQLEELADAGRLMLRAGEWFKPSYGNALYLCLASWNVISGARNLGTKEFFYFSQDKIDEWERKVPGFKDEVEKYLVPAITSSRYVKTFVFTERDLEGIRDRGRKVGEGRKYPHAWILVLHERRNRLPEQLQEYIKWGEEECRTRIRATRGGGRICSEAEACKARERHGRWFYGWYDLGGYVPTPIMAIYLARYHPQFFLVKMPLATCHAIITFIPRVRVMVGNWVFDPGEYKSIIGEVNNNVELDEVEVKALLAYLNSTFNWLWLEQNARYIAKGPLGLEVSIAERMPILNVKAVDRDRVEELARLFDELEAEARRLMGLKPVTDDPPSDEEEEAGGPKLEMFRQLRPVFRKVDAKIAEVLGIDVDVDALWDQAWEMMERRIRGAGRRVRPGAEVEINPQAGRRREREGPGRTVPLTKWLEGEEQKGL
jgi:type I restriction-modification system DNA methylase subunit